MQLQKTTTSYKKKYGNNYKKYSLEPIKNKYEKIIEYKIIESKYKNRNNVEMVFTRKNGSYATKFLRNGVEIKDVADIQDIKELKLQKIIIYQVQQKIDKKQVQFQKI